MRDHDLAFLKLFFLSLAFVVLSALLFGARADAAPRKIVNPHLTCFATHQEATSFYGKGRLRYREVSGYRCWYVAQRTVAKSEFIIPGEPKQATPAKPRRRDGTSLRGADTLEPMSIEPPIIHVELDDSMERTLETLCGGPCPNFAIGYVSTNIPGWIAAPSVRW